MYRELTALLAQSQAIVFLGGAGVSTESGIPDFRSRDGLYQAMEAYDRPPEELLSHDFFEENPAVFFDYYRNHLLHPDATPNDAHKALAALERQGKLRAIVTQNIDGLHQAAGSRVVHELHGSVLRNHCVRCGAPCGLDDLMDTGRWRDGVPRCTGCGGMVRPAVVLYGEALDPQVVAAAVAAIRQADLLLVGGTSLVVYPAAGLIHYFAGENLVLINKSATDFDSRARLVIRDSIGTVLAGAVAGLTE